VSDAHLYNTIQLSAGVWQLEECSSYMFCRVLRYLQRELYRMLDIRVTFSAALYVALQVGLQPLYTVTYRLDLVESRNIKYLVIA